MSQSETATAALYHHITSYRRHGLTPHTLDWAHQPLPTKNYGQLHRVRLDGNTTAPAIDYFELVKRGGTVDPTRSSPLDLPTISTALRLTHAITARSGHAGLPFYYRSVASAGALYPVELYLAVNRIEGLDPGLYHHNPFNLSLTALRRGQMPEMPPLDGRVAATFFVTAIFFRSAWKYRSRAYRYVLLDAGHLLENLRLALHALDLPFSIHLDFDDAGAGILLGLDPQREACLVCVHLIDAGSAKNGASQTVELSPLPNGILQASQVASKEITYDEILKVHQAGCEIIKPTGERCGAIDLFGRQPQSWLGVRLPGHPPAVDYASVLRQRRSRRNFVAATVSQNRLMALLGAALHAAETPVIQNPSHQAVLTMALLTGAALPVSAGLYLLEGQGSRLGQLSSGDFIESMARTCLDQLWLKHAAMHLLFLTDLNRLEKQWGPRGYRYAMIEAGRLGQQVYLAATALGWGVCGIGAIYDHEAAALLGLRANGALLYLVAAGPVKRA
jgi:SagB-type dehydrogenase family enzyme